MLLVEITATPWQALYYILMLNKITPVDKKMLAPD